MIVSKKIMGLIGGGGLVLICLGLFVPNARAESNALSLHDFVQVAQENNPRIREAHNRWKAAEYRIEYVKSLDDPMFSYGLFDEEVQTRVGPQEQKFGVSQKLPFPGKLSLKGKAQRKHAEMLREKYEETVHEVIKDVYFTYYDLFWIDKYIQITDEEKGILEKLEKVIQRKYESNQAAQQDVIKAQVELSKIIEKQYLLEQNRKSLAARLNSLLDRSPETEIRKILKTDQRSFEYELNDLMERSRASRQELKAADLSIEKSKYEKSLAQMQYFPDFTLGAEYIEIGNGNTPHLDDGQDAWMGTVSINVPIWVQKLSAQVREKEAELEAALDKQVDVKNQVAFEVQDLYFKIKAYKDIVLLYETALLPQAEQAFEASQIGFETGSITFLDWLDTERTYLQTRIAYYKSITDFHKSYALLERAVGESL